MLRNKKYLCHLLLSAAANLYMMFFFIKGFTVKGFLESYFH